MTSEDLDHFKANLSRPDRVEALYRAMVGWRTSVIQIVQKTTIESPIWGLEAV